METIDRSYGGAFGQAGNVSARIRYESPPHFGPHAVHVAAWVGVSDPSGDHWLQTGLAFSADGKKADVYVEATDAHGHYTYRRIAAARPGREHAFAVRRGSDGRWHAYVDGNEVGSVRTPSASSAAAVAEAQPGGAATASYRFAFHGVRLGSGPARPSGMEGARVHAHGQGAFTIGNGPAQ